MPTFFLPILSLGGAGNFLFLWPLLRLVARGHPFPTCESWVGFGIPPWAWGSFILTVNGFALATGVKRRIILRANTP